MAPLHRRTHNTSPTPRCSRLLIPGQVREFMSGLGLWTPSPSETAPSANGLSAAPPSGHATSSPTPPLACSSPSPSGFYALEISTISAYIVARPELCKRVGLSSTANDWTVKEVSRQAPRS